MKFLSIFQAVVSILLIVSILLQNRGSGLSAAFGLLAARNFQRLRATQEQSHSAA